MTPRPTIDRTRPGQVVLAAVVGLVCGLLLLVWWQGQGGSLVIPGVVAWASVLLLAGGMAYLAFRTRTTLARDRAALTPEQAVTRVLLGKTSVLAGALLGGGYVSLVAVALPAWPAPLAFERVLHGGLAVVACVLWMVAGAWLEVACRIPPSDGETPTPGAG